MEKEGGKNKNVLIIDDDSFMLDMYGLKFKERGFAVDTSLNGKDALKKLREGFSPDVILLDIIMPGVDGFDILEAINKEKLAGKAVIIALSNQWLDEEIEKARKLGVKDYIIKANTIPSEVLDKVTKIVEKNL
jgi:two-component system, OmpR family, response regulator MtrA